MSIVADSIANDRLVSTLFLATLFHGIVILGVTFNLGLLGESTTAPTLEVVLMNSTTESPDEEDEARYLAAEAAAGAGNTDDRVRPASRTVEPAPADIAGSPDATAPEQSRPGQVEPAVELIVSRSLSTRSVLALREAQLRRDEALLMQQAETPPESLADLYDETRARGERERERIVSVATRDSIIAGYLAGWKQKIEQVGTLNFPTLAQDNTPERNPVLEVAVQADGVLRDIIIRRSSGTRSLDESAVRILQIASPFDPFDDAMRSEYDVLRFVYEWQFIDGDELRAAAEAGLSQGTE